MGSDSPSETLVHNIMERFPHHLSGNTQGLFAVVAGKRPSEKSLDALASSARALGFSKPATFGKEDESPLTLISTSGLAPRELILAIETLDPLAVVSLDHTSAKALADAYHTQLKIESPQTLLGRPLCCFEDFDSMIATDEGKHNAWKLLKSINQG